MIFLLMKGDSIFDFESDKNLEHNVWDEKHGYHLTIIFCVLVYMILIHLAFDVITLNKNFILYGFTLCILVVIQMFIINYGGSITRTRQLSQNDIWKCLGIASLTIPFDYLANNLSSM